MGSLGVMALIEFELAVGCALLMDLWPQFLRRIALLLFAAFTGVALWKSAAGAPSCGCTGNLEIAPWLAAVADLSILAALWRWQPVPRAGLGSFQGTKWSQIQAGGRSLRCRIVLFI